MTYEEKIKERFEDRSNNGDLTTFYESLGAVSAWISKPFVGGDNIDDYIEFVCSFDLKRALSHGQLHGFVSWLKQQEIPEFDEEKGSWEDALQIFDKLNEYVELIGGAYDDRSIE